MGHRVINRKFRNLSEVLERGLDLEVIRDSGKCVRSTSLRNNWAFGY